MCFHPDLLVWFWAELEEEASRPEKDSKTLSSDLIEYVQYMIREHNDNYKVRAGNITLKPIKNSIWFLLMKSFKGQMNKTKNPRSFFSSPPLLQTVAWHGLAC